MVATITQTGPLVVTESGIWFKIPQVSDCVFLRSDCGILITAWSGDHVSAPFIKTTVVNPKTGAILANGTVPMPSTFPSSGALFPRGLFRIDDHTAGFAYFSGFNNTAGGSFSFLVFARISDDGLADTVSIPVDTVFEGPFASGMHACWDQHTGQCSVGMWNYYDGWYTPHRVSVNMHTMEITTADQQLANAGDPGTYFSSLPYVHEERVFGYATTFPGYGGGLLLVGEDTATVSLVDGNGITRWTIPSGLGTPFWIELLPLDGDPDSLVVSWIDSQTEVQTPKYQILRLYPGFTVVGSPVTVGTYVVEKPPSPAYYFQLDDWDSFCGLDRVGQRCLFSNSPYSIASISTALFSHPLASWGYVTGKNVSLGAKTHGSSFSTTDYTQKLITNPALPTFPLWYQYVQVSRWGSDLLVAGRVADETSDGAEASFFTLCKLSDPTIDIPATDESHWGVLLTDEAAGPPPAPELALSIYGGDVPQMYCYVSGTTPEIMAYGVWLTIDNAKRDNNPTESFTQVDSDDGYYGVLENYILGDGHTHQMRLVDNTGTIDLATPQTFGPL